MSSNHIILLLGSNKNFPEKNIEKAQILIEQKIGQILKKSKILKTLPQEFVSCNFFCNIALSITTCLSPIKTLEVIKKIEKQMGRPHDSLVLGGYFDREIDIDIVFFNDINFKCQRLEIPHKKHTFERDFSRELIEDLRKS